MEHFKNATRRLYAMQPLFFNIGLVLAISLCFIAFEFKVFINEEEKVDLTENEPVLFLSNDVITTSQPPKPKPQDLPELSADVNLVEAEEFSKPEKETEKELVDIDMSSYIEDFKAPTEVVDDNNIYNSAVLEVGPQFEGGIEAFYKYISNAIEYPGLEERRNIEGRVILSFVIEKDGTLSQIEVLKGVSKGIDAEAIRVLERAPTWQAGKQRGQPVRVKMNIPIYFRLR